MDQSILGTFALIACECECGHMCVCMHGSVCVGTHVCAHCACLCVCGWGRGIDFGESCLWLHVCLCMSLCVNVHVYVCVYVGMLRKCTYELCVCTPTHVYMHACALDVCPNVCEV